jgi:hypothetical protein
MSKFIKLPTLDVDGKSDGFALLNVQQIVSVDEDDKGIRITMAIARNKDLWPKSYRTSLSREELEQLLSVEKVR